MEIDQQDSAAGVNDALCQSIQPAPGALAAEPQSSNSAPPEISRLVKARRVVSTLIIAAICGLSFGFTLLGFFISNMSGPWVGSRDFVVYWATGRQLVNHANPYDRVELLKIERAAGLPAKFGAMFMRNPPSALILVYPLGFFSSQIATILWSLALLISFVLSVRLLWIMNGRQKNNRILLGYTFAPSLVCLLNGQAALFALLGLVLFLRYCRTRPFIAGAALWFCTLKPHLFLPFGVVLLAWIVTTKTYRILLGGISAIAVNCAIVYAIAPAAWGQYSQMVHTSGIQWEFIPCVAELLRVWIHQGSIWIQYLPAVLGCAWALYYFWKRRTEWDWMNHGALLMLVSILVAPYSWLFDQGLAIPALLRGAYTTRSRNLLITLALLSAMVEVGMLCNIWKPSAVYLWTMWSAPAWLGWYLLAAHSGYLGQAWQSFRSRRSPSRTLLATQPAAQADSPEIVHLGARMDAGIAAGETRTA